MGRDGHVRAIAGRGETATKRLVPSRAAQDCTARDGRARDKTRAVAAQSKAKQSGWHDMRVWCCDATAQCERTR